MAGIQVTKTSALFYEYNKQRFRQFPLKPTFRSKHRLNSDLHLCPQTERVCSAELRVVSCKTDPAMEKLLVFRHKQISLSLRQNQRVQFADYLPDLVRQF